MNQTEQILKKEMSMKRKTLIGITIGMALFYTLSIFFCFCIYSATRDSLREQALSSIANISQLNKDSITAAIDSRRILLETLAARLEQQQADDKDEILKELADFGKSYDFYRIGFMNKSKTIYLTDGSDLQAPDTEIAKRLWDNAFHVSESTPPYTGGEYMVNVFSYPVQNDGEIKYVLIATYYSSNLTERLNLSSMKEKGYTFLLNEKGEMAIYPRHYENEEYNALMKYINDAPEIKPDDSGNGRFTYEGKQYITHTEELGINDWRLLTCVKEEDVFKGAHKIILIVWLSIGVLWCAAFAAIGATFYSMRRARIKRTKEIFYDDLLDIPNKNALNTVYEKLPRHLLERMYMVIFDIDKFKEFNYIHGREEGDRLLQYIVRALVEAEPDVYLFRYMSDYFIALDCCDSDTEYDKKIRMVLERFRQDIENEIVPSFDISAGVRKVHPEDPLQLLISDALIARGTVKGNHLRSYAFYDEAIRNKRLSYMEIESNFSTALREKQFKVYYQPKVDMRTGEIIGAEALTRWFRPNGTMISPGDFIPCLEESRQIMLLDEEILSEVCRQMKEMTEEGLEVKRVSVNLSRVHLRNPGILPKIEEIIHRFGVDPEKLSFEITETVLYEDSIPLKNIVDKIHALGCEVEMDDYGVGVSGPNSLAKNSFDVVKLDKSLVDGLGNERVEDVIRSTAHMAGKWGMRVLVEGVETLSQAERLMELGCTYAQGYYFSKPVPEEAYRELLRHPVTAVENSRKVPVAVNTFSEEVSTLLDGYSLCTYAIDPKNYLVMYSNKAMNAYLGEDPTGGLCYRKLRGQEEPCEDCPAMWLYRDGKNIPKEVLGIDGRWAMLLTSYLHWQGREYIQICRVDITKQKEMEEELRLRSREYEMIIQQSVTGIMRYDIATDTATVNVDSNLERVEEYTVHDCIRMARGGNMIEPESIPAAAAMRNDISSGMPSRGYEIQIILQRGGTRWCHFDYTLLNDQQGIPYRAVISFYDNTEQREKELAYQNWNAGLSALMDEQTIYVGVNITQDVIESENRFGTWMQEGVGQRFGDLVEKIIDNWVISEYIREFRSFFNRERLLGMYYAGQREDALEYVAISEGRQQWFKVEMQMVNDPASNDVKASLVFRNVDEEVRERKRLLHEAERDSLTGLYNRATMERLIREVLAQNTGERCCFLLIDLDDLRGINSVLGHPEGDRALQCIADVMRAKFRKGDILGRIGGDEFVAFLRNVPEADRLKKSISDFVRRVREHSIGRQDERGLHVSVGGSIAMAGKDDFNTIYEQADLALYYTKANGKNAFHFYIPEMENREFLYQPSAAETAAETDWYQKMEMRRLVKAMAAFFPLVFSVNLTKNTYSMMEYEPYTKERAPDTGSFDELMEGGMHTFHPDDREGFLACFARENLLRAYAEGKRIVGHKSRQMGVDGVYHMVHTVVLFMEKTENGDVCTITFANVAE